MTSVCWILNRTVDFNTEKLNDDFFFLFFHILSCHTFQLLTENVSGIESFTCDDYILRKSAPTVLRRAAFSAVLLQWVCES